MGSAPMRPLLRLLPLLLLALTGFAAEPPLLTATRAEQRLAFTAAEFATLPRSEATASDPHAKTEHRYSGVTLREILTRLAVPTGKDIRGAAQQLAVLVRGADGYAVVFSLSELDAGYGDRQPLLCDREDGAPLSERHGPIRLIVPGDQFAARWVRNVSSIELITVGNVVARPKHP